MKHLISPSVALACLAWMTATAPAHYNMLLPEAASVKRGEAVTITYQWGHPFEHQLFDAPPPRQVFVLAPDGKATELSKSLEKVALPVADGKQVTAYRLRFTPEQRGDYVFLLRTPPIWLEEDQEFLQDTVKVVLHVQVQKGWDQMLWDHAAELQADNSGQTARYGEMVPLTRPYGLQPGLVFQAQAYFTSSKPGNSAAGRAAGNVFAPLTKALVEIERYNPTAPAALPADEQITRTARTDPNGIVTYTLPEPGWWCITAQRDGGKEEHDGKAFPVRQRTTLWVFVDEKTPPKVGK
jgi:cobalt/nickel transport protein